MFVYESVPGTVAEHFRVTDDTVEFEVEGDRNSRLPYSWKMIPIMRYM